MRWSTASSPLLLPIYTYHIVSRGLEGCKCHSLEWRLRPCYRRGTIFYVPRPADSGQIVIIIIIMCSIYIAPFYQGPPLLKGAVHNLTLPQTLWYVAESESRHRYFINLTFKQTPCNDILEVIPFYNTSAASSRLRVMTFWRSYPSIIQVVPQADSM